MGEVFRARDVNLGRSAAIKVLPVSLIGDPERMARFEREAQTLASLNHPNIAQIFGFEKGEGSFRAIAMEFVEGPTLPIVSPAFPFHSTKRFRSPRRLRMRSRALTITASSIAT